MKRMLLVAILALSSTSAFAQNTTGLVVSNCGVLGTAYMAGRPGAPTIDTSGNLVSRGNCSGVREKPILRIGREPRRSIE